jgi:hypothetical protein
MTFIVFVHCSAELNNWRVLNLFWVTEHDFKPIFPSLVSKRYSEAATFLNVYPFVLILFFKLCVFLIFTASDSKTFNITFNVIYGGWNVFVIMLLLVTQRPNRTPIPYIYLAIAKMCAGCSYIVCVL